MMKSTFAHMFSKSSNNMKSSEIRELLKLLNSPEMISFAGGLPNPDAFPIEKLKPVMDHVMASHARDALQYGTTEGHNKLRDVIARGMGEHYGAPQQMSNILITNGSQQGLNLISKVFLNPGDKVLTGNPTYLGAIMAFVAHEASISAVTIDEQGMVPELLEDKLKYLDRRKEHPKFMYLVPTFQNPTGVTIPHKRREKIYEIMCKYDLILVEDDPYGLLRFEGKREPLMKSFDDENRVIYLGTFSKILAPGFRVGWMAAPEEIIRKVSIAKQAEDLCTNSFGQFCVFEAMYHNILFPHIEEIVNLYRKKRDLMIDALETHFPKDVRWNKPQGGLFLWLVMPDYINTLTMLPKAIENNVAYVTGEPFFPNGGGHNTMRLNYSYATDDQIVEGIKRLADVIKEFIDENKGKIAEDYVSIP
ncbi:MAG: hypothetical protein A2Y33_06145 [Spirochaetes bacterium GWF1_51_8]|nr:MAG: hypothetical protein A2Y33_06145 [Spirochaetes bacterium GWF1_51_8]